MGQNEDCSPEDSTSDSSEKLLQRGRGKDTIYTILVKGQHMPSRSLFFFFFLTGSVTVLSSSCITEVAPGTNFKKK